MISKVRMFQDRARCGENSHHYTIDIHFYNKFNLLLLFKKYLAKYSGTEFGIVQVAYDTKFEMKM